LGEYRQVRKGDGQGHGPRRDGRKELADPAWRISSQVTDPVEHGRLQGALRIPNTVGALNITADLRARSVVCSVDIDAPKEGRPTTKVNWLVRQL
jgi:hypothetical protein